jgi:rhodanese-related sulfurtransferase
MSSKILQINFTFRGLSRTELEQAWLPAAQPIADTPGLHWKVWLVNERTGECGGVYLFDDEAAAKTFLNGPIVAASKESPVLSNASVKIFDIMAEHTVITRGPVGNLLGKADGRPTTFGRMAEEAYRVVRRIKPADARRQIDEEPTLLVIDVRDATDVAQTGTVPGALNLSLGSLTYIADNEVPADWRHPQLADRNRPIITTCILGPLGAIGGKLLHDMGFKSVQILDGGVQAWIDAGLPVVN